MPATHDLADNEPDYHHDAVHHDHELADDVTEHDADFERYVDGHKLTDKLANDHRHHVAVDNADHLCHHVANVDA